MDTDRLEIERITNLIKNFGWEVVSQKMSKGEIVLIVSKPTEGLKADIGAPDEVA